MSNPQTKAEPKSQKSKALKLNQHILEIVSDSGEGAQKCGQSFASISAKMGNGVWTVEIIPAEIQPPARSRAGGSGIRIRLGSEKITNMGNEADIVVALNEQVMYGRIDQNAYEKGTVVLIENKWRDEGDEIKEKFLAALDDFEKRGYIIHEIPMEKECLKLVDNPRKGKNMWVLGMLCSIYNRDVQKAEDQIKHIFRKKTQKIIDSNLNLLHAGYDWSEKHLNFRFDIPAMETDEELVVMNGNEAIGLGIMAAGIEVVAMYPITPATSASHYLAEAFEKAGGIIHQAEDEISAVGFAIGSSYSGKTAATVTSGPGIALKTEFLGLAAMAEVPLVVVDVQRGGPSTGLPTKVEQGDLLAVMYGQPGDAPKIIMAPATIEECFRFPVIARKIAESFRTPVFILSDANLATGQQPFPRPKLREEWLSLPIDQSPWKTDTKIYDWNEETGLSKRPIPGQPGGVYTLTGLAHDADSLVTYHPDTNQYSSEMRSLKLATFKDTLKAPAINGKEKGDLLIVGWGSTLGSINEAVADAQKEGLSVSSLHLRFLNPLEPGLTKIFKNFKKVMTVEINYSDDPNRKGINSENRRYSQLAWLLRAQTLVDVDCYSNVKGQPMKPREILERIKTEIN